MITLLIWSFLSLSLGTSVLILPSPGPLSHRMHHTSEFTDAPSLQYPSI